MSENKVVSLPPKNSKEAKRDASFSAGYKKLQKKFPENTIEKVETPNEDTAPALIKELSNLGIDVEKHAADGQKIKFNTSEVQGQDTQQESNFSQEESQVDLSEQVDSQETMQISTPDIEIDSESLLKSKVIIGEGYKPTTKEPYDKDAYAKSMDEGTHPDKFPDKLHGKD